MPTAATRRREIGPDDGRRRRREKNRDAVIEALLGLVRGGDLDPTVVKIAERAGVSHRSVFRYFDDFNDLGRTAIEQQFRETLPLGVIPGVGTGPRPRRTPGGAIPHTSARHATMRR